MTTEECGSDCCPLQVRALDCGSDSAGHWTGHSGVSAPLMFIACDEALPADYGAMLYNACSKHRCCMCLMLYQSTINYAEVVQAEVVQSACQKHAGDSCGACCCLLFVPCAQGNCWKKSGWSCHTSCALGIHTPAQCTSNQQRPRPAAMVQMHDSVVSPTGSFNGSAQVLPVRCSASAWDLCCALVLICVAGCHCSSLFSPRLL